MANETTLNMILQFRRDPEFNANYVLEKGEPGFEISTNTFKIGDGTTTWENLKVANETQIRSWIETVRSDLQGKLDSLDATYVTDTDFTAYQQAITTLLGTFSIGNGEGKYADIKAYIDAMDAADQAYARAQDSALEGKINEKIGTKGTASTTTIYGAIKAEEDARKAAIGTTADTKDKATVYGAIAAEAEARTQADTAINNKIGDIGTGTTVGARLDAVDQAAADAQGDANSAGQAAQAAQKDIDDHIADKNNPHGVTKAQLGLGNVDNKSFDEIKADLTGSIAANNDKFVKGGDVHTAIENLKSTIGNLTNVMNFRGAVTSFATITDPVEGDVITFSQEFKEGENVRAKTGSEWVYSGNTWVEIGTASASDAAIADLQSRIGTAESNITTLGNTKLDTATFNSFNNGTAKSVTALETAIGNAKKAGDDAQAEVDALEKVVYSGPTGTATTTSPAANTIMKEIDDLQALTTGGAVAEGNTKLVTGTAVNAAINSATQALDTAIKGGDTDNSYVIGDTKYKATIKGAKEYAKDYADSLAGNYDAAGAASTVKGEVIGAEGDTADKKTIYGTRAYTDAAKTELIGGDTDTTYAKTIKGAKDYASAAANATKSDLIGGDTDTEYAKTIKGAKDYAKAYADSQDTATLNAAKAYADEKVAGAVTKVSAGTDIVVTPTTGTGDVTVAHKAYGTGTYTKPDAPSDANFVTGVTIENGHVTGASVKSLAEALSAMTFIFDGGTSATTVTPAE